MGLPRPEATHVTAEIHKRSEPTLYIKQGRSKILHQLELSHRLAERHGIVQLVSPLS